MNIETAIQWFYNRLGKVTYSMVNRNGPSSYDCSSAVYHALIEAGGFPANIYVGNTDTEYGDLEKYGWKQVPADANGYIAAKRGDIFLWGVRGQSGGSLGHTGIFVNANDIIHCSYGYNGIAVSNHDWLNSINGYPPLTVYRYFGGSTPPAPTNPVDQVVEVSSFIKFPGKYRVSDVQHIADMWQVKSDDLLPAGGFTWADNGIPAAPLVEVNNEGHATIDQELDPGSLFVMPGKYQVLDVGQNGSRWLAQIQWSGYKFWVDLEPAVEVSADDPGTPTPTNAPEPIPEQPEPTPEPNPDPTPTPDPTPQPEQPEEATGGSLADLFKDLFQKIINWLSQWRRK